MIGKYSIDKVVVEISKLPAEEFLGVCKILNVKLMEEDDPKSFIDIWEDLCKKLQNLTRTQRKNLLRLLRAANEDR